MTSTVQSQTQVQTELSKTDSSNPAYLFEPSCKTKKDCDFCEGLGDMDGEKEGGGAEQISFGALFKSLSFIDRYLAIMVLLAMVVGVLLGVYAEDGVRKAFHESATWDKVSIPILVGLLIMIWPPLTKVEWEHFPRLLKSRNIWKHLFISFVLNWIVAPLIMLALAWATLPEDGLSRERKGVLLVGVARCIAMVLIWTTISQGDTNYCAMLVVFNSLLQVVLFSPYAVLFVNHLGVSPGTEDPSLRLDYPGVSRAVGIYLGIPLAAGMITRFGAKILLPDKRKFNKFMNTIGPLAVVGLLYTIIVLFAYQGKRIVHNIGTIFRISVPLILYFTIVWTTTFFSFWYIARYRARKSGSGTMAKGGYERAVTQAFTTSSNNFELAIAVGVASFGADSPEALAATLGPLIEVPVLLFLSYVSLWLRGRLWDESVMLKEEKGGAREDV